MTDNAMLAGTRLLLPDSVAPSDQRRMAIAALGLNTGDALGDAQFDRFADDLAKAAQAPHAFVNLITDQQTFIGLHTEPDENGQVIDRTMPLEVGYCPMLVGRKASTLVLADVLANPRYSGNPVVDILGVRCYVGAQVRAPHSDIVIGSVCFIDTEQRNWSTAYREQRLARETSVAVADYIDIRYGTPQR